MKLKLSKYTIIVKSNEYLLLYNSIYGIDSLCKVSKNKYPLLCEKLLNKGIIQYDKISEILVSKHILVENSCDEEAYRKFIKYSSLYSTGTNLIIMPTEQCNFKCTYCYEDFDKPIMSRKVINELKGYISRNIYRFQSLSIDWFGGEPLCAYNVVEEIMKFCKSAAQKRSIPIISTMTTNGYLLSWDTILKLLRLNVIGYQITIDGIEQVHDKQRKLVNGKGTYKRIIQNLLAIKYKIKTGVLRICIRVNLNSFSIKYTKEFFEFLKENFEDDNRFSLSLRYVRDLKGNGETTDVIEDDFEMLKVYKQAAEIIPRLLSSHFINMFDSPGVCYAGKPNSIIIGSDGTLYKCTVHFNDDINIVGRLENSRLITCDDKISKWIFSGENVKECKECWYRGACYDGVCPYSTLINPDKKTCPFEKIHIEFILDFLNNQNIIKEIYE